MGHFLVKNLTKNGCISVCPLQNSNLKPSMVLTLISQLQKQLFHGQTRTLETNQRKMNQQLCENTPQRSKQF